MSARVIRWDPDGSATCLWSDELPLADLGLLSIDRASNVEFDQGSQQWQVMFPGDTQPRFSHASRAECILWEIDTLNKAIAQGKR